MPPPKSSALVATFLPLRGAASPTPNASCASEFFATKNSTMNARAIFFTVISFYESDLPLASLESLRLFAYSYNMQSSLEWLPVLVLMLPASESSRIPVRHLRSSVQHYHKRSEHHRRGRHPQIRRHLLEPYHPCLSYRKNRLE